MKSDFLVSIKCVECGAPINYPEGAYTFKCSYCGSALRIKRQDTNLKYIIPCQLNNDEIKTIIFNFLSKSKSSSINTACVIKIRKIYKPFWYVKGLIYYSFVDQSQNDTLAKYWYHSFQANSAFLDSFSSLSVRTEVLRIHPYDADAYGTDDIFLPVLMSKEDAQKYVESITRMNFQIEIEGAIHEELNIIGEHFTIIYYPIIYAICATAKEKYTILIDGINMSILADKINELSIPQEIDHKKVSKQITFLAHRCKNCGYDLQSRDFDVVFYCTNCSWLWLLKDGEYSVIKKEIISTEGFKNAVYIPFWRFEARITSESAGIEIKDIGDLSKFMKMGRYLLRSEDPKRSVRIYCPAIVGRNARAIIKLATRMNIHQKDMTIQSTEDFPYKSTLNASILDNEAEQMLRVIVFKMIGRIDPLALKFFKDFQINIVCKRLVLYPFEDNGDLLFDRFHQNNFPKKSLEIGVF